MLVFFALALGYRRVISAIRFIRARIESKIKLYGIKTVHTMQQRQKSRPLTLLLWWRSKKEQDLCIWPYLAAVLRWLKSGA
jgi:hypothetical protein